jgi:Domain of unknown function (DUF4337)
VEAREAFERHERAHQAVGQGGAEPSFTMQAAITVAVLAAFLAIATFLVNEAVKDAIQNETKASEADSHVTSFETQSETALLDGAILRSLSVSGDRGLSAASKAGADELDKHTKEFDQAAKALKGDAADAREEVDHANQQHLIYELAVVGVQIGIVLASVSIIARRRFLLTGSWVLGVAGVAVLMFGLAQ